MPDPRRPQRPEPSPLTDTVARALWAEVDPDNEEHPEWWDADQTKGTWWALADTAIETIAAHLAEQVSQWPLDDEASDA